MPLLSFRMRKITLSLFLPIALASSSAAQTLLVANQGDRTVSLVDPISAKQVAVIQESVPGQWGHELATSPDGRSAYLPIYGNSGVGHPGIDGREMLVIDIAGRRIAGKADFGRGVRPHRVVYDPNSKLLYVTTELAESVTIVDPRALTIIGSIPTGQPESHMLAISHDGKRGYTANVGPGSVSVLDLSARKTLTVIPIAPRIQRISISNDDKMVFTADQSTPRLAVIDATSNEVKAWIPLPAVGYGTAPTKDGRWLLVALPTVDKIAVVDLTALKLARSIDVCRAPQEVIVPGDVAYVSCSHSNNVAAIDLGKWKVSALIKVGKGADGLAWAKRGM